MTYDVIVLGGGPGGYLAAERAGQAGLKALLIEETRLGGTCLNRGCIPTETLLHSARLVKACRTGESFGVACGDTRIDQSAVIARKRAVSDALVTGVGAALRAAKVTVLEGRGIIQGRCDEGFRLSVAGETYTGRNLIIATGSRPVIPDIPGLDKALESGFALTSSELLELETIPETLCVVGGGVIGLEMATYYAIAGSGVNIVEAAEKIAGGVDRDITAVIQEGCRELGMLFHLNARAVSFREGRVTIEENGEQREIECDKVLVCIGRRANLDGFGLESLSLPASPSGIKVDEHCLTGTPGVYAVGDCNGTNMLAHVAYRQAEVAVANILGRADVMRWDSVPGLVHTMPEAAVVGLTEEEAAARGIDAAVSKISMNYSGLYMAENRNGHGIIKLVFDRRRRRMIGAHIVGGPASELITICSMMIDNETELDRLKQYVFPHPTNAEAIREAIFALKL